MSGLTKALRLTVAFSAVYGAVIVPNCCCAEEEVILQGDEVAKQIAATLPGRTLSTKEAAGIGLSVVNGEGSTQLTISTKEGAPAYDVFTMENPPRIVLDLPSTKTKSTKSWQISDSTMLKGVRLGAHNDRTRVVLDLANVANADEVARSIEKGADSIALTLSKRNELPTTAQAQPALPATEQVAAVEKSPVAATVGNVTFQKTKASSGQVMLTLSQKTPFELKQTAPSEYSVIVRSANASEKSKLPQIAPAGFKGIRSARAVQQGDDVLVRMFVDPGVTLSAKSKGSDILVTASVMGAFADPSARAQIKTEGEAPAAATTEAEAAPAEGGDETARMNPTGISSADGSKVYTGRLISLDLQETDIDNALRIIAEVSNLNIIASDDVTGKVTLRLIDVPWDQALDVILKTNGLDQVTEGNVIRIAPVDKLRQEREALLEAKKAAENLEDLKVNYVRISYARASDLKEQIESVLSERGSVAVDERTNQLIVKDIVKGQEEMMALVKRLDLRTPQVLLETQIVEASRGILRDLGFQWNFAYSQSPATGNATGNNFPNSVVVGGSAPSNLGNSAVNFPAAIGTDAGSAVTAILDSADGSMALAFRLSALEQENRVKVISRPQVATVNNKEAEIKSTETVRIRLPDSGLSVATGQGASASGGGASAFEEVDVGIELRVTPQASPDYYVLLDIYAKSSTFGDRVVDNIPSTLEREATSTILVQSGQTFALGGVYRIEDRDQVAGVPFLKDIPFLGYLFRRTLTDNGDEELIFFITPHIVEGSFDPSLM